MINRVISKRILKELEPLTYCVIHKSVNLTQHVYSTINNGLLWIRILLVQPIQGHFEYIPTEANETRVVFLV